MSAAIRYPATSAPRLSNDMRFSDQDEAVNALNSAETASYQFRERGG
jgi:hypothetical protein